MLKAIDHVVLVARDLERSLAFYRDVLGCRVLREAEWRRGEARFPSVAIGNGQMLNLHEAGTPVTPEAVNPQVGSEDLCFVAATPIAEVQARLAAHGVPVEIGPVQRMGGRGVMGTSVYFRDPDGNLLEIMAYGGMGSAPPG
jgi:catechol 2,3-dioxygenase-like lactoylglutathione lyase family enzyme